MCVSISRGKVVTKTQGFLNGLISIPGGLDEAPETRPEFRLSPLLLLHPLHTPTADLIKVEMTNMTLCGHEPPTSCNAHKPTGIFTKYAYMQISDHPVNNSRFNFKF